MTMAEFQVEWVVDVEAGDVYDAASRAWDMMRTADSTACVFEVSDHVGITYRVDLADGDVGAPVWVPNPTQLADLAEWMAKEQWDISEIVEMIRRPHKYASEYSTMIMDREFDKVAKEPEQDDDSSDETTEEN
jgi:hypothetical protein